MPGTDSITTKIQTIILIIGVGSFVTGVLHLVAIFILGYSTIGNSKLVSGEFATHIIILASITCGVTSAMIIKDNLAGKINYAILTSFLAAPFVALPIATPFLIGFAA